MNPGASSNVGLGGQRPSAPASARVWLASHGLVLLAVMSMATAARTAREASVPVSIDLTFFDYLDGDNSETPSARSEWNVGPCTVQFLEPCNNTKMLFYHFPSVDPYAPELLNREYPEPTNFNANRSTHILVHGYVGHLNFSAISTIYKALLRKGDSNVMVVDWGRLAAAPCYPAAVFNTLQAGRCTGEFVMALARTHPEMSLGSVHAIGFSLGAHVAAFASNTVKEALGSSFGRITGLDPALPLFATLRRSWKLDADDADFVDIFHTNVGIFGKVEAVGHTDVYFNGGSAQPACAEHKNVPLCSHLMSAVYYAESIESDIGFWGLSCPSFYEYIAGWCGGYNTGRVIAGEYCNTSSRGVYFVETASEPPYAIG